MIMSVVYPHVGPQKGHCVCPDAWGEAAGVRHVYLPFVDGKEKKIWK